MAGLVACSSSSSPPLAAPLPSAPPSSPTAANAAAVVASGPAQFAVTVLVTGSCQSGGCQTDSSSSTVTATDCGGANPRGSAIARYGQELTVTDMTTGHVGHTTLKAYDSPPVTVTDPPQATCRFSGTVAIPVGHQRPGLRTVRIALGPVSLGLLTARITPGSGDYAVLVNA